MERSADCDIELHAGVSAKGVKGGANSNTAATDPPTDAADSATAPTVLRNVDTSALGTTRTLPLPFRAAHSCMAHDRASVAFALANGCMTVVCCRSLVMTAVSPVLRCPVQSLVFSADDSVVMFVDRGGVFGVWRHGDFHERVYGGALHSSYL